MAMKRSLFAAALASFALAGASAPAPAAANACFPDPLQATCETLDACYLIGVLMMSAPPNEAVTHYRTCLFTDREYAITGPGRIARRSTPLRPIYESTFWSLYCRALRRAGQTDPSICNRRAPGASERSPRAKRRSTSRRQPAFTG